jgi:hypothetical protein
LNGTADRAGAYKVHAIEVWESACEVLALLAAFGSEVWIGNVLVVFGVVVAFGVADEVDRTGSHSKDVYMNTGVWMVDLEESETFSGGFKETGVKGNIEWLRP